MPDLASTSSLTRDSLLFKCFGASLGVGLRVYVESAESAVPARAQRVVCCFVVFCYISSVSKQIIEPCMENRKNLA